jgi:CxxC motif-containing protein (DUF1111 family)
VATARTWRTAPLIGLRFSREFLHDGRAITLQDAVMDHDGNGSEAHDSVQMFLALTPDQQAALLDFVGSL